MTRAQRILLFTLSIAAFALPTAVVWSPKISHAAPNGVLLTGMVKSASGEKMGGVTVSAKIEDQPITTSVFTDEEGNYYFPNLQDGKYQVWAQAVGFESSRGDIDLRGAVQHNDFVLKETKDFFLQLSGDQQIAALPEDTVAHRRMKDIFMRNCISCHEGNVALQNRLDEQGWEAIINAMSLISASGGFRAGQQPSAGLTYFKKDLAAYLAEMRGPVPSPMQLKIPPRPAGDATLPVIYSYDIPMEAAGGYVLNNGNDWSLGPSMASGGGLGAHDAQVDWNGNIWFTYNNGDSVNRTIGKINGKTGKVTDFKHPGENGRAATSHGITIAHDGIIWFTLNTTGAINAGPVAEEAGDASGKLGKIDPKTENLEVFTPTKGMAGANISVDEDGQGYIWASTGRGALRFNPKTEEFTEFKSLTQPGGSYGMTGDRDGNGWWTQISIDKIGHSDVETGKSLEIKVPPNTNTFLKEGDLSPEDLKAYGPRGMGAQAPRRLGADKNGDDIWVPDYSGNNLLRINVPTLKTKYYPAPRLGLNPYMAVVDNSHNVWMNLQGSDDIAKFDPKAEKWTLYSWPLRGTSTRALHVLDRNGMLQLTVLFHDANRVGRMVVRTREEMEALKTQVQTMASAR